MEGYFSLGRRRERFVFLWRYVFWCFDLGKISTSLVRVSTYSGCSSGGGGGCGEGGGETGFEF